MQGEISQEAGGAGMVWLVRCCRKRDVRGRTRMLLTVSPDRRGARRHAWCRVCRDCAYRQGIASWQRDSTFRRSGPFHNCLEEHRAKAEAGIPVVGEAAGGMDTDTGLAAFGMVFPTPALLRLPVADILDQTAVVAGDEAGEMRRLGDRCPDLHDVARNRLARQRPLISKACDGKDRGRCSPAGPATH